jgi:hypothetical protein
MTTSREEDEQGGGQDDGRTPPRDLIEFYRRWSEFRPFATRLASRSELSASEREVLGWLILLADRISDHDLQPN